MSSSPSIHRYPPKTLRGDYWRGGIGLALFSIPFVSVPMLSGFQFVFGTLTLLFGGYVARTWLRGASRVEADENGVAIVGPMSRRLAWEEVEAVKLSFYSVRRSSERGAEDGWMQLNLRGKGGKLAVDSHIEDFERLLRLAAEAARVNRLELSEPTVENFSQAGIKLAEATGMGRGPEEEPPAPE